MKKVLVTGGKGFIGSHLVSRLLSLGMDVLVLDKSIQKPTFCDIQKAQCIEGDVLSQGLLQECLEQVDTCFHLAANVSMDVCTRDWIFSHENNVLAFNGLLEQIHQANHPIKLIYTSSCAVYGNSQELPLKESQKVIPISTYGADKLSNEIYAEVMAHLYSIEAIGLRLFNVYGPGQLDSSSYTGVITCFKNALKTKQAIKIFGDGYQTRDFIYVDDVVRAFIRAAEQDSVKSGVFNICSGHSITILDLAKLMMDLTGITVPIINEDIRAGDTYHSLGDGRLAAQELDYCAEIPIDTGLHSFLSTTLNLTTINKGIS